MTGLNFVFLNLIVKTTTTKFKRIGKLIVSWNFWVKRSILNRKEGEIWSYGNFQFWKISAKKRKTADKELKRPLMKEVKIIMPSLCIVLSRHCLNHSFGQEWPARRPSQFPTLGADLATGRRLRQFLELPIVFRATCSRFGRPNPFQIWSILCARAARPKNRQKKRRPDAFLVLELLFSKKNF